MPNSDDGHKSLFSSIRNRFSRKQEPVVIATSAVTLRATSHRSVTMPVVPLPSVPDSQSAAPTSSTTSTHAPHPTPAARAPTGRNPLANPSGATRRPTHDAPPPYTAVAAPVTTTITSIARATSPTPSDVSTSSRLRSEGMSSAEDPYAFLSTFDTIFVIDDSGSMAGRPWREVQAVLGNITPICTSHDADGIDIYFLNHRSSQRVPPEPGKATGGYTNVRDAMTVARIFESVNPGQSTPTGTRLRSILSPYLRLYEETLLARRREDPYAELDHTVIKPVNLIVITDGAPTDELDGVLIQAAKKLDALDAPPYQVGVQFFQVGNERGAAEYLRDLDDNLGANVPGGLRDIVDTVTWNAYVTSSSSGGRSGGRSSNGGGGAAAGLTAEGILKVVLGAVVKRLDRKQAGPVVANRGGNQSQHNHRAPRHLAP